MQSKLACGSILFASGLCGESHVTDGTRSEPAAGAWRRRRKLAMFNKIDKIGNNVYYIKRYGGSDMGKTSVVIMPQTEMILEQMGEQIKLARLRRKLSAELVAERAGISRATLWSIEKGTPTVAIGMYAAVLHALNNLDKDLLLIAKDDEFGRKLQDLELVTRKRAPKERSEK